MDNQRANRRQRHLIPDLLDRLRRVVRVLVLELISRRVVELAAEELLNAANHRGVIACHPHGCRGLERIHQPNHVGRPELPVDKARQRLTDGHAGTAPDMVVVEEDGKQPHVIARGLGLLVVIAANLLGRSVSGFHHAAVQLHQLEGLDLLWLAILGDVEVALLQIGNRVALLV